MDRDGGQTPHVSSTSIIDLIALPLVATGRKERGTRQPTAPHDLRLPRKQLEHGTPLSSCVNTGRTRGAMARPPPRIAGYSSLSLTTSAGEGRLAASEQQAGT